MRPYPQHARPTRSEEVPDGVPDDVALLRGNVEALGACDEEIRLRLRANNVSALDHNRLRPDSEVRRQGE